MKKTALLVLAISGLLYNMNAQEYRGGVSAEFRILKRLEAEAEIELRKIFIPESYFNRTFQGSLGYEITNRWSIGATYSYAVITEKHNYDHNISEEALDRNKLAVDLDYQSKRFGNDLRLSNRFRYQISTGDDDDRQYFRNRVMVDYKISSAMNPYLAFEPYYRFDKERVSIVRIYIGNEMPLFNSKIDLYYIAEIHQDPQYTTAQYIIGLTVELDFKP